MINSITPLTPDFIRANPKLVSEFDNLVNAGPVSASDTYSAFNLMDRQLFRRFVCGCFDEVPQAWVVLFYGNNG